MMYWAVVFFVIALVAAFFGFGNVSATASELGKTLFYISIIVFVVSLVLGFGRRGRVP